MLLALLRRRSSLLAHSMHRSDAVHSQDNCSRPWKRLVFRLQGLVTQCLSCCNQVERLWYTDGAETRQFDYNGWRGALEGRVGGWDVAQCGEGVVAEEVVRHPGPVWCAAALR
jgi:hypothetical protein